MSAPVSRSQPTTASERDQIVARLSDLQAKQEAATGWGAAVGAREEEIRSLESRLLRIDYATAPPSTETPHTATPWRASKCGYLMGTDDSEGAKGREVQVGKIGDFFDKQLLPFNKDRWQADLEFIVTAANSHASLTARVAELVTELQKLAIKQHIRMASGGGHVNNGRSCAVCMGAWEDHAPEFHAVTCPLFDSAGMDNADGGRG